MRKATSSPPSSTWRACKRGAGGQRRSAQRIRAPAGREPSPGRDLSAISPHPDERAQRQARRDRSRARPEGGRSARRSRPRWQSCKRPFLRSRSATNMRKNLFDRDLGIKIAYLNNCRISSASKTSSSCRKAGAMKPMPPLSVLKETRSEDRSGISPRHVRRPREGRAKGGGALPGRDQGRAQSRAANPHRAGRRRRPAARRAYGRRRGHARPGARGRRAARRRSRDRSHGVESRYRFRLAGPGGRDQGRHLQLHPLRADARARAERLAGRREQRQEWRECARPKAAAQSSSDDGKQARSPPTSLASRSTARRCRSTAGPAQLAPGMSVTVEIKTGSRRIISYLLSPLLRYKQEVLRER